MEKFTSKNAFVALLLSLSSIPCSAVDVGGVEIPEMTFEEVGTAVYTDAFFKSFFEQQYGLSFKEAFGIDVYTTEVVLEEAVEAKGYYRLVHPYKQLCEEVIPQNETWGCAFYYMEDSDYLRINAVEPGKAYVDVFLLENLGIYPMDGMYEYETPLFPASGAWWMMGYDMEVPDDYYLVRDGDVFTVKPTPAEDFDSENTKNVNTPLMTVAMWTDPVNYGTVERYYPASVGSCDFRVELRFKTSGVEYIGDSASVQVSGGSGTISVYGADEVVVMDINGRVIYRGAQGIVAMASGIYIVKVREMTAKVVVK